MFERFQEEIGLNKTKKMMKSGPESDFDHRMSERMLENRTILLSSDVTASTARRIIEQLLVLESLDPEKPITFIVNSPGGDVNSGLAIYDMIQFIKPTVKILCSGLTASIATIILSAVPRENRFATPMTRFLLHQPLIPMDIYGPASELEITAREILKTREVLNKILARATGKTLQQINEDTNRDFWMDAQQAVDYGLVGRIIKNRDELEVS